jgi:hypothetical protein
MDDFLISADDCLYILSRMHERIDDDADNIHQMIREQESRIDFAVNAVPAIRKILEDVLYDSIIYMMAHRTETSHDPALPYGDGNTKTIAADLMNFLKICDKYKSTNSSLAVSVVSLGRKAFPYYALEPPPVHMANRMNKSKNDGDLSESSLSGPKKVNETAKQKKQTVKKTHK